MAPDLHEVEQFARIFEGGSVPPFPQSLSDLPDSQTVRAKVQNQLPELWERLHGEAHNHLPADVYVRHQRGQLNIDDVGALRTAGMESTALQIEADARQAYFEESMARLEADQQAQIERNERERASAESGRRESALLMNRQFVAQRQARQGY